MKAVWNRPKGAVDHTASRRALRVVIIKSQPSPSGDSNNFFLHDVAGATTEPALRQIMHSSFAEHDVDYGVGNLKGLEVLARAGSNDGTVPPWYVRRMVRMLQQGTPVEKQSPIFSFLTTSDHFLLLSQPRTPQSASTFLFCFTLFRFILTFQTHFPT